MSSNKIVMHLLVFAFVDAFQDEFGDGSSVWRLLGVLFRFDDVTVATAEEVVCLPTITATDLFEHREVDGRHIQGRISKFSGETVVVADCRFVHLRGFVFEYQ